MRLSELLTYVTGEVEVFECHTDRDVTCDPYEKLYRGPHEKVPKDLLKREVMYVAGGRRYHLDVCLVREKE